jgi:hypothetical protein
MYNVDREMMWECRMKTDLSEGKETDVNISWSYKKAGFGITSSSAITNLVILACLQVIFSRNKYFILRCSVSVLTHFDCTEFQSGQIRDAAWRSDWVGSPISHQRSLVIVMTASNDFILTAGKIIPVSRQTIMQVRNELNL